MIEATVRQFLEATPVGVLATMRKDGRIRQSVVYHVLDGDRILISTEPQRAKARDVDRTHWASYCVLAHEAPFGSVTVEGKARIVREGSGAATTKIFEKISGSSLPEPITDEQCETMNRVILELTIDRTYGAIHLNPAER
jgi:PPOX class probable F420-dependent enzyme